MTKPMIKIHNTETDEVIEREMTEAEYAEHLKSFEPKPLTLEEAKAAEDKEAAQAKLAALGLTADDLKALGLGSN
jgi:hypothetical protein